MSGYKVDGDLHGTDEFEFTGTDGGGLVTMNERVTGIATALRQKLKVKYILTSHRDICVSGSGNFDCLVSEPDTTVW